MKPRFLILLRDRPAPPAERPVPAAALGLTIAVDCPQILAMIGGDCRHYRLGDGHVLGTLYPRFGPARPLADATVATKEGCSAAEAEALLLKRYYGAYLALFPARAGHRLLRDPSAALPCYYAETSAGIALASDVDLLLAAGLAAPAVHWAGIFRHHYLRGLPTPETCLQGVEELLPGYALDVSAGTLDQRMSWSPWSFVDAPSDPPAISPQETIRRAVKTSIEALTGTHDRLLLSVSGELDSSIVAACLAESGRTFTA